MKWWHGSWEVKQEAKKFIGFDKKEDVFVWFYYGEFEQWAEILTRKEQNVQLKTKELEWFVWQPFRIHITNVSSWRSGFISACHSCWNLLDFFSVSGCMSCRLCSSGQSSNALCEPEKSIIFFLTEYFCIWTVV